MFACLAIPLSFGAPIALNQNLILNFGAEVGAGSASGNDIEPVPDWTTTGTFTVVQYGAAAAPVVPPGPGFGNNFFSGGLGTDFLSGTGGQSDSDQATQIIDLSGLAGAIDAGQIDFSLSGFFGGYLNQDDNATLLATFFNGSDTAIGTSLTIGGFNATARNGQSILLYDSTGGLVPAGTRSVEITLVMTKLEGYYDDGYADNLSFSVTNSSTSAPEPSTWVLAGLGGLLLGIVRARKRFRAFLFHS